MRLAGQAARRGFPLCLARGFRYTPAFFRRRSSVVERILGKAEVDSSILSGGTTSHPRPSRPVVALAVGEARGYIAVNGAARAPRRQEFSL